MFHFLVNTKLKCHPSSFFCLKGMFSSRGRRLLMADADGASKFADLAKLEKALDDLNGKKVSLVFQNCAKKWTKALLG